MNPASTPGSSFQSTLSEVLGSVDALFGTQVSFVSRIDGDEFHILDAIDRDVMGFHPGQVLQLRDTF